MTILEVPGTWNARDIGSDAAHVPGPGVLFRSATLSKLTDSGVAILEQLKVGTVLDLRSDVERSRDGSDRVPPQTAVLPLTFNTEEAVTEGSADPAKLAMAAMGPAAGPERMEGFMYAAYRSFVADPQARASTAVALRTLVESDAHPVWVHCSAGKDRTGWFVALVQTICGCTQDYIEAEYLRSAGSADRLAAIIPDIPGLDRDALYPALTVRKEYLRTAFSTVEELFENVDNFLDEIGIDGYVRTGIRDRFGL